MSLSKMLPSVVKPYDSKENMDESDILNRNWIPIRKRIEPLIKNLQILSADEDKIDNKKEKEKEKEKNKELKEKVDESWNEHIKNIISKSYSTTNKKSVKKRNNKKKK